MRPLPLPSGAKERIRRFLIRPSVNKRLVKPLRSLGVQRVFPILHRLPVVGEIRYGGELGPPLVMATDGLDAIASDVYWGGTFGYEPEVTRILPSLAAGAAVAVDVGANTGFFTMLMARAGSRRVIAFEPVPRIHERLLHNVGRNRLENVTVERMAVGDRTGTGNFFVPRVAPIPTSGSLDRAFYADSDEIPVEVVTLDGYRRRHGLGSIGLLKIDVEGREMEVLRGAAECLEDRPYIICEVLDRRLLGLIAGYLGRWGYRVFVLRASAAVPVENPDTWDGRGGSRNFLFSRVGVGADPS